MKKILFVDTNYMKEFNVPYIKMLKQHGFEVHCAGNNEVEKKECDKYYNLKFSQTLFSYKNFKIYKKLKRIISKNQYDIIQCDTYLCGILTHMATKSKKVRIIYRTFDENFIRRCIFEYLIQKKSDKNTNILIATNTEDYKRAKNKLKIKNVKLINGVGINEEIKEIPLKNFEPKKEEYIFCSVGELNKENNQIIQLEAMIEITRKYPHVKLIILGKGDQEEYYEHIIEKYGLNQNVRIVNDEKYKKYILKKCNCIISSKKHSEMLMDILMAMMENKPIIASNIKGYRDILKNKFLFNLKDTETLKNKMLEAIKENHTVEMYYDINKYKLSNVKKDMEKIYGIK